MGHLDGKLALVTGGARGVGAATVRRLAAHGAHVLINCFHSYDAAKALAAELRAGGARADVMRASVAKQAQVEQMFAAVARDHGHLDILVNNAAAGSFVDVADTTPEHFTRAFETNVLGAFRCAEAAAPLLRSGGAIVNVSSIGAELVPAEYLSVGTSKAALEALTRYLAVAYAPRGIRVNTASCSLVEGEVARLFRDYDAIRDVTVAATPLGRLATAEDLADVILFLASDQARWVTGQTLLADGGLSLGSAMLSPPAGRAPAALPVEAGAPARVSAEPAGQSTGEPADDPDPGDDAIAVVGMGLVLPGANSPEEFWQRRVNGPHVFTGVPADRWRVESFHDTDHAAEDKTYSTASGFVTGFVPHPRLAEELADGRGEHEYTTLWLRHAVLQALDGVTRSDDDRVSAFMGYTADGSQHLEEALVLAGARQRLDAGATRARAALESHLWRGRGPAWSFLPSEVGRNAIAGVLPDDTELFMLDTACSSSLYAVDLGMKTLQLGGADVAVCGGAFALGPRGSVLFSKLGGLSRSGVVRSLDRSCDGVLFSDGAGVVVLKKVSRARRDGDQILGVIVGSGSSSDGKGKAIYAPSPAGQRIAVTRALEEEAVADGVDWVVAHATGTPAGDLAELTALRDTVRTQRPVQVTSNKSVIGHTGWAAGVASLIEVLLGLRHDTIPPQIGFEAPPDELDIEASSLRIPTQSVAWSPDADRPRSASVSSFGFGGTNSHLVVQEYHPDRAQPAPAVTAAGERVVVTAWTAHVPGLDGDGVAAWLRGEGAGPGRSFGDTYPLPPFQKVRIPPKTLRTLDRCQLMVLECVDKLRDDLGPVWERYRDTTGILAGHMGPTRTATLYALRCYLDDLAHVLDGQPGAGSGLERLTTDARRLVPASNEDSFPGMMPNVIPARVANYFDFHGLNMTVDTGVASTLSALEIASRYLRTGDLDVALVYGISGNSTPEYAEVLGDADIAEGAFCFALTRESVAREQGLPVLGVLDGFRAETGGADRERPLPAADGRASYLGADGAIDLLTGVVTGAAETTVRRRDPHGAETTITLRTESVPAAEVPAAPTAFEVARHVATLQPYPLEQVRPALDLFGAATVVLTDDPTLVAGSRAARAGTVLSTVPVPERPGWHHVADPSPEAVAATLDSSDVSHVVVVSRLSAAGDPQRPWEVAPREVAPWEVGPGLTALHDLTFCTLQTCHERVSGGGSFTTLLLDGLPGGTWHPYAGLFTGLTKSAALEWPDSRVVAVVTSATDPDTGWRQLTDETTARQFLPVVAYDDGVRKTTFVDADDGDPDPDVRLDRSSVVVACGGARGITAELLKALAAQAAPTIYVLGTNALDAYPDDLLDLDDDAFAARRKDYLRDERSRRPGVPVADLNREFDRMAQARTARRNLATMAVASGADRVHYLRCDLRDAGDVAATMNTILERCDGIDLLLNAAGLNRSAAIATKRWADFRAVRDIKLDTYANLKRALAATPPRTWCNFGSFVGFTGQVGEADYASANDFLATASAYAAGVQGADEFTIGWTLWREVGLGSNPVTKSFLEKSNLFTSMSTAEGVAHFLHELSLPVHAASTVHLGDIEKRAIEDHMPGYFDARASVPARPQRFYVGARQAQGPDAIEIERVFDLERDAYLAHHVVDGHPTLPGTFVPEIAAQAALELAPDQHPAVFEDATFHHFLRLYGHRPAPKKIRARVLRRTDDETAVAVQVLTDVVAPNGTVLVPDKLHFSVTVRLRSELPAAPHWDPWPPDGEFPVPDPYHVPNPAVHLTGPFVSTARTRAHPWGRRAAFDLQVAPDHPVFSTFVVPSILLDGLARTAVLEYVDDDYVALAAPARMRRIDLYEARNDCDLARTHEHVELYSLPRGLDLEAEPADNRCLAVAPDGHVILQIKDITGVVLGYIHAPTGTFVSPGQMATIRRGEPISHHEPVSNDEPVSQGGRP